MFKKVLSVTLISAVVGSSAFAQRAMEKPSERASEVEATESRENAKSKERVRKLNEKRAKALESKNSTKTVEDNVSTMEGKISVGETSGSALKSMETVRMNRPVKIEKTKVEVSETEKRQVQALAATVKVISEGISKKAGEAIMNVAAKGGSLEVAASVGDTAWAMLEGVKRGASKDLAEKAIIVNAKSTNGGKFQPIFDPAGASEGCTLMLPENVNRYMEAGIAAEKWAERGEEVGLERPLVEHFTERFPEKSKEVLKGKEDETATANEIRVERLKTGGDCPFYNANRMTKSWLSRVGGVAAVAAAAVTVGAAVSDSADDSDEE